MKTLIKYITLLLVSGVIVPFYLHAVHVKTKPAIAFAKAKPISNSIKQNDAPHFSFINDVAAKLLPEIKYFQPCL